MGLHSDALEDLVGKGAKGVLDAGSGDDVGGGSDDAVSAPDAAIGVVVDHDELLAHAGVGGESGVVVVANLDDLLHHGGLDGGERVIAVGGDAVGAVGTVVAEVALAALDLAGVPKLVEVAVGDISVGVASGDVAGGETARAEVGVVHGGPGTEGKGFAGPGGHIAVGTVTGGGSTASTGEHDLGKGVALGDVGNGDGAKLVGQDGTIHGGGVACEGDVAARVSAHDGSLDLAGLVVSVTAFVEFGAGIVGEGVGSAITTSAEVKLGAGNSIGIGTSEGEGVGGGTLDDPEIGVGTSGGESRSGGGVDHAVTGLDGVVEGSGEGCEVDGATGSRSDHRDGESAFLAAGHLAGVPVVAGAGARGVAAGQVLEPVARAIAPVLVVAGELLDVLAGTVAGAGVGAGGTTAALALVAVEALAFAGLAVAQALVAAVGALEVLVAGALVIGAADAVAGAPVRAHGRGKAKDGNEDGSAHGQVALEH